MILAPLLGLAVDMAGSGGVGGAFWPVGAAGLIISLVFLLSMRLSRQAPASRPL